MKLNKLRVSNYRIHSATTVEFGPDLTLVGGPNESGKSTLVEAAFNALFMRSKKTGEELERMQSRHGGNPEVELTFEQDGETYTLKKIFKGGSGSRTYLDSGGGGDHWEGDEAEQKLFELLGMESPSNSRAIPQEWAHLWVRQGQSSLSPSETAAERQHQLFDLLQQGVNPAAAIIQSPEDSRLGREFDEMVKTQFNRDGSPKANTDLSRAQASFEEASLARQAAENKCAELEVAAESLVSAQAEYDDACRILTDSQSELKVVEDQLRRVETLTSELTLRTANRDTLTGQLNALIHADRQIRNKESELAAEEAAAAPLTQAVTDAAAEEQKAQTAHGIHDQAHQGLMAGRLAAETLRDLHSKCIDYLRLEEEITSLRGQVGEVGTIRNEMTAKAKELGGCSTVTAKDITKLQSLETACTQAKAALDVIATRIEIVRSSQPVVFDGKELIAGESVTFSEGTDLSIGDMVTIRITPGGGLNLHEAREALRNAETAFAERLRSHGVADIAGATAAQSRQATLQAEIQGLEGRLAHLGDPGSILASKEGELQVLEKAIKQQSQQIPGFTRPVDLQTATRSLQTAETNYALAKENETNSAARLRILAVDLQNANVALTRTNSNVSASRQRQNGLSAQIALLIATHGNLAARTQHLASLRLQVDSANGEREATQTQLDALQPDLLNDRKARLESACRNESARRDTAFQRCADARAKLVNEGDMDPRQTLAVAMARESAALRRLQEKQRHGDAVKLLARLFAEERGALNTRLAAPLEEKVGGYLQCIFGRGSAASIPIREGSFSGFNLRRDGVETFDFSALSGGTKEQVAIAFRLAMAEVLAADHGGSLPIILDDAFTNSDEERTKKLRDMLYRATTKGLQVIVFSCNPRDYQGLGGKTITLPTRSNHAPQPVHAQALPGPNRSNILGQPDDPISVKDKDEDTLAVENKKEPVVLPPVTQVARILVKNGDKAKFLITLGGMPHKTSTDQELRSQLGWDESSYVSVKEALLSAGKIRSFPERGGGVSIVR